MYVKDRCLHNTDYNIDECIFTFNSENCSGFSLSSIGSSFLLLLLNKFKAGRRLLLIIVLSLLINTTASDEANLEYEQQYLHVGQALRFAYSNSKGRLPAAKNHRGGGGGHIFIIPMGGGGNLTDFSANCFRS